MSDEPEQFDEATLMQMNEKAIQNQFFTPDHVYIELGLLKDIPLGCIYMEHIVIKGDEDAFKQFQIDLTPKLKAYQTRVYDTIDPYLGALGYTDDDIAEILSKPIYHDYIFMMAPMTKFFNLLIRHMIRNQNHSKPAEKFVKKRVDNTHYTLEPMDITYRINTYPLQLSEKLMLIAARELGESFGVNIEFMCKNPSLFDQNDWDQWLEKMDCLYLDSIGRLTKSPFIRAKQHAMQFVGIYFFVRKRFEKEAELAMRGQDFELEIQQHSARMGILCDFEWLQNNDTRLTEEGDDVPMNDSQVPT